jgi:Caspase domain
MARRALIIAIEHYALMEEGLAPRLPGTHDSALEFRRWLLQDQGLAAGDITMCVEDPALGGGTAGATMDDALQVLLDLRSAGRNLTEHLYVYLSGHGFAYTDIDNRRLADVLLLAEYRHRGRSGNACLSIDSLQHWLRAELGPGEHFYFVDCCRNPVRQDEIKVPDLPLTYEGGTNGAPTIHTLYSTVEGAVAAVESGFSRVLISGLKGAGRAKEWLQDYSGMAVKFRPVSEYVKAGLPQQQVATAPGWGDGEGLIRELVPAPVYELKVVVENAEPGDTFDVGISTGRGQPLPSESFTGAEWTFRTWPPDDYNLVLSTPGFDVEPLDGPRADLYDACTLRFRKTPPGVAAAQPSAEPAGPVTVRAPDNATVRVRGMTLPETCEATGEFVADLPPDRYAFDIVDHRGARVGHRELELQADGPREVDLTGFPRSPLRDSLLARLPHRVGAVDFSETLGGATPDQGLDLWLALIGASRILQGAPDDFSKLGPLPLATFFDVPPDGGPLYVLAGFDEPPERITLELGDGPRGLLPHPELPGLFELPRPDAVPGSHLVTLAVDGLAPLTLASASVANRATLIVFDRQAGEPIRIRQLILPLPHLHHQLRSGPPPFRTSPLNTVRRSVEIQRQFEGGRKLSALLDDSELDDLLFFKWSESVMCLLGAYELARRGRADRLAVAASNLQRFFTELPDSHEIARLAGEPAPMPDKPPIVLDGYLSRPRPAPPGATLDMRGPWTLWRGRLPG